MVARKCQKMNANAKPGQGQIAERDIKESGRPRPRGLNEVGEDAHAPCFFGITPPSNFLSKIRHFPVSTILPFAWIFPHSRATLRPPPSALRFLHPLRAWKPTT